MQGPWRIECFGGLRGVSGDAIVSRFRTRRAAVLLAYLAIFKHRSHPREEIGAMLWPEDDPPTVRTRLRLALASLRRQFEPPSLPKGSVFLNVGDALQMNAEMVGTDVEEFERLITQAGRQESRPEQRDALQRAVALYRGELLPGFTEDWIFAERTRLADLHQGALQQLTTLCDDWNQAVFYARKLLVLDPWQEEVHLQIMRGYLDTGNPRAALRQFEELIAALDEIGEEPGPEALDLAEEAKSASPRPPTPVPSSPTLVDIAVEEEPVARLPVRLTRFFGRSEEMEYAVRAIIEGPGQLVTLCGPGGAGKTRLSIEIGHTMVANGWNVWFVPLADVGSAARIYDAILTTLKIEARQDAVGGLVRFFRRSPRPLLVLDNAEHLMSEAAEYIGRLLREIPELRCVVTTRQRLALEGELEVPVIPLPVPSAGERAPDRLASLPSVQLYVDRCQMIRPDFQLSGQNARPIAELCARLEGIPLAIEIAASLSRTLSARQLVDQLEHRFDVLVSPRRDISDRQKTLGNTIAYSYDLLTPELAKLFLALSVFRGGWTLESAQAVCLGGAPTAFGLLDQLRERSLIETYEVDEGALRFRMLEAFREFGQDRLDPETRTILESARDAYFLTIAQDAFEAAGTPREGRAFDRLRAEYDNLMHVFELAAERGDVEFGLRLASGFGNVWRSRGAVVHERSVLERILALPARESLDSKLQLQGFNLLQHACFLLGDWERTLRAGLRTLELAERFADDDYRIVALAGISNAYVGMRRQEEARHMLEEAARIARETQNHRRIALLLGNLGAACWRVGDPKAAEAHFREALAFAREQGAEGQINHLTINIARTLVDQGRLAEAMEILPASLERATKLHRPHDLIMALGIFARLNRLTGDLGRAWALIQLAITRLMPLRSEYFEIYIGLETALELVEVGRYRDATPLLSAISKHDLAVGDRADLEAGLSLCRKELEGEFDPLWANGFVLNVGELLRTPF